MRVEPFRLGERSGRGRDLPCARHTYNLDRVLRRPASMKSIERPLQQAIGDHRIPARDNYREAHALCGKIALDCDWTAMQNVVRLPEAQSQLRRELNRKQPRVPVCGLRARQLLRHLLRPGALQHPRAYDRVHLVQLRHLHQERRHGGHPTRHQLQISERRQKRRTPSSLVLPATSRLETKIREQAQKLLIFVSRGDAADHGDSLDHGYDCIVRSRTCPRRGDGGRMTCETLLVDARDGVALLTINRVKVLNALNTQVFDDLESVVQTLAAEVSVRVLLITGAGEKAFAAGADISELAGTDAASGEAKSLRGQSVFRLLETCGKPVIALVNGFALGGGCELALACTFRLASETARLGQPEVKLGLIPGYGGSQRLPRLIGSSAALKLLLTGEMVGAAEALRLGLVDEVHPPERLLARGWELASAIAAMAPLAIAGCLEAVHQGENLTIEEGSAIEAGIFGRLCGTDDKAEGTRAFLEKRPATWSGR